MLFGNGCKDKLISNQGRTKKQKSTFVKLLYILPSIVKEQII
jgi:hypothetical protein